MPAQLTTGIVRQQIKEAQKNKKKERYADPFDYERLLAVMTQLRQKARPGEGRRSTIATSGSGLVNGGLASLIRAGITGV